MLAVVLHFTLIAVIAWELVIVIHVKRALSLGSHGANKTVTLSRTSVNQTKPRHYLLFLNIIYNIRHSHGTPIVQLTSSGRSHLMPIAIRAMFRMN